MILGDCYICPYGYLSGLPNPTLNSAEASYMIIDTSLTRYQRMGGTSV